MKMRSTGRPSGASKSIARSRRANTPKICSHFASLPCGIATPSPTPVEPSLSRCSSASKISRAGRPDTSAARVLEHDDRSARQIEFGHGGGDRKGFQRLRPLRHNNRIVAFFGFFGLIEWSLHDVIGDLALAGADGGVPLEPLLVAAQTRLDLVGGLFETRIRLVRPAFRVDGDARTEPERAVGAVSRTLARDDHVAADSSVEVTGDDRLDFFRDMLTQRFPDIEVLAGYSQSHR